MSKHTLDVEHHATLARMAAAQAAAADSAMSSAMSSADSAKPFANSSAKGFADPANAADKSARGSVDFLKRRYKADRLRRVQEARAREGDPLKYHLDVGKILMRYYDISKGVAEEGACAAAEEPSNSILAYFQPRPEPGAEARRSDTKASLMDAYMAAVHGAPPGQHGGGPRCAACGSANTVVYPLESLRVCSDCDISVGVVLDTERQNAKDGKDGSFVFKRISHLVEWLNASSGRENTVIPPEVFATVLAELRKRQITNLATVSHAQIRAILKKLRLSKYYEHTSYIMSQLNGRPTKPFDQALEDSIKKMFVQIQAPFVKFAPQERKNFLSYSYVLHKFCELLGRDEFLDRFPLLKSRDKLYVQDKIWRAICVDLGWEFIPSI